MLITNIIIVIVLFLLALLPIISGSEEIYKSNSIKIGGIVLLLILLGASIVLILLEKNEAGDLQDKIDLQLEQLDNLRSENRDLEVQLGNLKNQLSDQIKILKLNSELDNYISQFLVRIYFDKKYSFDEIHPTSFGYEFYIPFKEFSFTEVLVTDDSGKLKKGISRRYMIYDVKRGGKTVGGTQYGGFERVVSGLESKITVMPDTYTIRSIQDGIFTILLEPNLIDKTIGVMFVVDNWVLIRQEVDPSKWEKISDVTRLIGWENYGLDQKVFYRIKPEHTIHNKNNPWKVDLYKYPLHKLQ